MGLVHIVAGYFGGALIFAACILYIGGIFSRKFTSNKIGWGVWSLISALTLFTYYGTNGLVGSIWVYVVYFVGAIVIFILLLIYSKGGTWSWFETATLIGVGVTLVAWILFRSSEIAMTLTLIIDIFGATLIIKNAYLYPNTENGPSWYLGFIGNFINLAAIEKWDYENAAYPIYTVLMTLTVSVLILLPLLFRKRKKKDLNFFDNKTNNLNISPDETSNHNTKDSPPTYDNLIANPELYNNFIYTTLEDAVVQLRARKNDGKLNDYLKKLLPDGPPATMQHLFCAVLFRHMATPNFEAQRFSDLVSGTPDLHPVILEYLKDKFTNRNGWKFKIAKLRFLVGLSKSGTDIVHNQTIIDINASNFKPIYSIKTYWGENLFDFHHRWFDESVKDFRGEYMDISGWLANIGPSAKNYYKAFLALFLKYGVLFDYFLLHGEEEVFTKEIVLPALIELQKETGYKPLIVRLQPSESEGSDYWLSYSNTQKSFLDENLKKSYNT